MKFLLLIIFFTTSLVACKKANTLEDELAKLPPDTQEGKNTLGCLVNGKAWIAQRDDCASFVCDPPFKLIYDGRNGGNISVIAILIKGSKNETLTIGADSTIFYNNILVGKNLGVSFFKGYDFIHSWDSDVTSNGEISFSKIDLANRIISGTFKFTLYKMGWDTIKVTNGRFDGKLY